MKRNKTSTRAMRRRGTASTLGNSKYALKFKSGKMKYGPVYRVYTYNTG